MLKRTAQKKDKKDMSPFEKFVTDGHEKADELAKAGAMLDEGFMVQTRATTVQQEREEVYAAAKRKSGPFLDKRREQTRHRTEGCAAVSKFRCRRCGRGNKYMKMQGKCTGQKLPKKFGKMVNATCGRPRFGAAMSRTALDRSGTKTDERLQAEASGYKRAWQHVQTNSGS